jgi:beta-lactamase regulating signal transducer with metallopeptidase domain
MMTANVWPAVARALLALIVATCTIPLIALVLTRMLARARSSVRHRIWVCATAAMLAATAAATVGTPSVAVMVPRAIAGAVYALGVPVSEPVVSPQGGVSVGAKRVVRASNPGPLVRLLLFAWLSGTLFCGARMLTAYAAAARLVRRLPTAPPGTVAEMTGPSPSTLAASCQVRIAPAGMSAFTWGVHRPCIVMPADLIARRASARLVFAHELHHVRSQDVGVQMIVDSLCAVMWWNPLLRLVRREIRREREIAADTAVLDGGADPQAYGLALLTAASTNAGPAPAAAQAGRLESRIRSIARWRPSAPERAWIAPATWTCAVLLACLAGAAVGSVHVVPGGLHAEASVDDAPRAVLILIDPPG